MMQTRQRSLIRITAALCLVFALSAAVLSQETGKIAGKVHIRSTGEPLIGAVVIVKGTQLGASTDIDGNYFILNILPGEYEISASFLGYQKVTQSGVVVNINRTTTLDFSLQEQTVDIGEEVVVVATRPDVQREKTSTSEIVRAAEVQELPGITDITGVLALSADVVDGHFRGGRENEELYNLAGMGIVNPLNAAAAFIPNMSAVEEVEVITSGFGAQYGNAQSGVVNISMKEGSQSKWTSRAELRTRIPNYKFFGANPFSEDANPYLQLLNSWEKWRGIDSSSTGNQLYLSTLAFGFDTRYMGPSNGKDTAQAAQIAHALWRQARRMLNQQFDNLWDYSVDVTLGGPLADGVRMFLSSRMEQEWGIIPTPEPMTSRKLMGNVAIDVSDGMNVRFSGAWTVRRDNLFAGQGGTSYSNFYNWLWDPVQGISRTLEDNGQLGVRFVHTLDERTYYEVKINRLSTSYIDAAPIVNPDRYVSDDQNVAVWRYFNTPDNFRVGQTDNDFRNERTGTTSFDASITSQITNDHMLLAGMQANAFTIDVHNKRNMSNPGSEQFEAYVAKPFEWGLYAQDKMEFEGMIANIGLRLDYYNQNVDYYADSYNPFRYINAQGDTIPLVREEDLGLAPKAHSSSVTRLQPRIGISFPVSENTVFHINYGSFLQRPSFERTVYSRYTRSGLSNVRLGNPQLKPQDTKNYDIGIAQSLGKGFTIDASGYYKDVSNLLQLAIFSDVSGTAYQTFVNRDYADIRGINLSLRRRTGDLRGSLKYRYEVATGKSATPFNATPKIGEPIGGSIPEIELPSPKDIIMDFDRTHNIVLNLMYTTDREFGFQFNPIGYPLGEITLSVNSNLRSGRPYTFATVAGLNQVNNRRSPLERNTDLKVSKRIRNFFGADATLYAEVFNAFNNQSYDYTVVFQSVTSTTTQGSTSNQNIDKYENRRDELRYYDQFVPFLVDQEFMLYDNEPRSIWLGLVINF